MNIHMKQCKVTYLDFHFCFQCYVFLLETRLPPTLEGLPTNNFITSFLLFDPFGMTLNCQILCNILSWTFCHCYSFRKTPMNYYRFFLKLVWIFFNFRNVYYYVATTIWQYLVTLRLLKLVHFLQVMNIMVLNFYLTYNIGFFQHLTLVYAAWWLLFHQFKSRKISLRGKWFNVAFFASRLKGPSLSYKVPLLCTHSCLSLTIGCHM